MWTKITRKKYGREKLRFASDTTDVEWSVIQPLLLLPNKSALLTAARLATSRCGRLRDRKERCAYAQLIAEAFGIARKRAPLVPNDGQRLSKRFAPVRNADKT